jgi:hypothetical protein
MEIASFRGVGDDVVGNIGSTEVDKIAAVAVVAEGADEVAFFIIRPQHPPTKCNGNQYRYRQDTITNG